jgi:hypothetical protein
MSHPDMLDATARLRTDSVERLSVGRHGKGQVHAFVRSIKRPRAELRPVTVEKIGQIAGKGNAAHREANYRTGPRKFFLSPQRAGAESTHSIDSAAVTIKGCTHGSAVQHALTAHARMAPSYVRGQAVRSPQDTHAKKKGEGRKKQA